MLLEHVNLTVRDLDRSIACYCEPLGFESHSARVSL